MIHLLAITWKPGLQGLVDLAVTVAILIGAVLVLLALNNGIRLGFLLLITAFFAWMSLMFLTWLMFPIGYKGPEASWKVLEVSYNLPEAATAAARNVPKLTDLPQPQALIKQYHLESDFKGQTSTPTFGDVLATDPSIANDLKPKLNGWQLLPASSSNATNSIAAATGYLVDSKMFPDAQHLYALGALDRGGKPPMGDTGMWNRITHRVEDAGMWVIGDNPTHYAVVQVQASNYTDPVPGQKPPIPAPKAGAAVISVVMVRDLGAVRLPSFALLVLALIGFAISANALHRRDKMGMAARAAAAPKLPGSPNGSSPNGSAAERKPAKEPESAGVS